MRNIVITYFSTFQNNHHSILLLKICILRLKVVSCRQRILGFCFYIQSDRLCLLIGMYTPFTFNVIINLIPLYLLFWLLAIICVCACQHMYVCVCICVFVCMCVLVALGFMVYIFNLLWFTFKWDYTTSWIVGAPYNNIYLSPPGFGL